MTNRVDELLLALQESPTLKRVWGRNSEGVCTAFGLTQDEKDALRSGDLQAIKSHASPGSNIPDNIIISWSS